MEENEDNDDDMMDEDEEEGPGGPDTGLADEPLADGGMAAALQLAKQRGMLKRYADQMGAYSLCTAWQKCPSLPLISLAHYSRPREGRAGERRR
jgi:hypothetical protein